MRSKSRKKIFVISLIMTPVFCICFGLFNYKQKNGDAAPTGRFNYRYSLGQ